MRIKVDHYHHFPPGCLTGTEAILEALLQGIQTIMASLDNITAEVAETKTVVGSAIVLIDGLAAKIEELKNDPVALQALADSLNADNEALAAKVAQNTVAETETPEA